MKRILAVVLSLCLVMIGHTKGYDGMQAEGWEYSSEVCTTRADDEEDLLRHFEEAWAAQPDYTSIEAHRQYLLQYFRDITGEDWPEEWSTSIGERFSHEMARIYNEFFNDIDDHPYLRGDLNEETGEITITGVRKAGYITKFFPYANGRFYGEWDYDSINGSFVDMDIKDLVIPDEIDGHPVTKIAKYAFAFSNPDSDTGTSALFSSVTIGDNVREIGDEAFSAQRNVTIKFGKNVESIGGGAFRHASSLRITDWGNSLKTIGSQAFYMASIGTMPLFPDTLEDIGHEAFGFGSLPETVTIPRSVQSVGEYAFDFAWGVRNFVLLSKNAVAYKEGCFWTYDFKQNEYYCYAGSPTEEYLKNKCVYHLIDGDSLLWDREAVEGKALTNCVGMTEAELRTHLSIDGTSSEIQIDGLQDGKVVNGTTVTLFHTIAQAPGKVYTVEITPVPVSAQIETLPTKTNYIYKEAFDPTGLSLRITYDNGDETVVTDNITCTGTDLTLGTNTITATYENVSATFAVTVRYTWWQYLIRFLLFGFLWY